MFKNGVKKTLVYAAIASASYLAGSQIEKNKIYGNILRVSEGDPILFNQNQRILSNVSYIQLEIWK